MKLLLHMCCANCAIYPVDILRDEGHEVSGFFFNPNIHPYQEYRRRLDTVHEYAARTKLDVIIRDEYLLEEFLDHVSASPGSRCDYCYRSRLEETARTAARQGYEAFSSSLLYSRYQQHETIRAWGEEMAARFGIRFVYRDFRAGWKDGINASKSMGLYRQQYCGCIYSEKDRYHPRSQA